MYEERKKQKEKRKKSRRCTFFFHVHLLDLLAIEDLDGYFIARQNVLCDLNFAKGADAQRLAEAIVG